MKTIFKKCCTALAAVAVAVTAFVNPAAVAASATSGSCEIAQWNDSAGLSGGCTCWVATRVLQTSGKLIPWRGDARYWWANATWPKNSEEPRRNAIAAFGNGTIGHVAFVESVVARETSWTKLGMTSVRGVSEPYYRNQQRYDVTTSNVDYYNKTRGVYPEVMSSFLTYYTVGAPITGARIGGASWGTPRNLPVANKYGGLLGFIYP